uniref:Uncharacterized protein n=1 Tax=Oncorhynchus mykiss TaxID=8022 RepID=A0A8K9Y1P3_ONCMY
ICLNPKQPWVKAVSWKTLVEHGCNTNFCSPLKHGCSPLKHGCSPLKHGCSPLKHGCSPLKHGCSPLKHGCSPLTWVPPFARCSIVFSSSETSPSYTSALIHQWGVSPLSGRYGNHFGQRSNH